MKVEQILENSAKKNMKRWELNTFKITHPTLYKTIIEAINEALTIPVVVVPNGALFCPYCGDKRQLKVETDLNSGRVCKSRLCKGK